MFSPPSVFAVSTALATDVVFPPLPDVVFTPPSGLEVPTGLAETLSIVREATIRTCSRLLLVAMAGSLPS